MKHCSMYSAVVASALGILAGINACRTPGDKSGLNDTQVRSYEGELGMKPGVGYESVFEDVRGQCVDFDGVETDGSAQQVTYELSLVENHRELGLAMNVSAASQVKAAIPETPATVSAKTQFMLGHSYSINRYSVFVLAKVQVRNETTFLKGARIKDNIKQMLNNATPEVIDQLRLQCGDAFMSAFTTGGEFFGVLEIQTENAEEQTKIKHEMQAAAAVEAVGEVQQEQSMELQLKKVTKGKNLKIWSYQKGGSGAEEVGIVTDVDQLFSRIRNFPSFVRATTNAAKYTGTFSDYFTLQLTLPTEYQDALFNARDVMDELAGIQMELIDRRGDIDYIVNHPNSFIGATSQKIAELKQASKDTVDRMREIYKAAKLCHRKFRECKTPDHVKDLEVLKLPPRKPNIEILSRDIVLVKTKLQHIDVDSLYDAPFNPPDCYLEVRINAGNKSKRLYRTAPDYGAKRCDELDQNIELPLALIQEAAKGLGVDVNAVSLEVRVMDDDPGPEDQVIGKYSKPYKDIIEASAALATLTANYITMDVAFEVR